MQEIYHVFHVLLTPTKVESDELADATLYREIVCNLIYVMTVTSPDLCNVVTKLSQYTQYMSKPTKAHSNAAKHVH